MYTLLLSLRPELGEKNSQSTHMYTLLLSLQPELGEKNSQSTHMYTLLLSLWPEQTHNKLMQVEQILISQLPIYHLMYHIDIFMQYHIDILSYKNHLKQTVIC